MILATASAVPTAPASQFFALWADMGTWSEWNTDTEWARLDGPFQQGATGSLKPKGGPKVRFTVEKLTDDQFVDVSQLLGARLVFDHRIDVRDAGTAVSVQVSITGPLRLLWTAILGKGLRTSVVGDLAGLVAAAEARVAAQQ